MPSNIAQPACWICTGPLTSPIALFGIDMNDNECNVYNVIFQTFTNVLNVLNSSITHLIG